MNLPEFDWNGFNAASENSPRKYRNGMNLHEYIPKLKHCWEKPNQIQSQMCERSATDLGTLR
jgi:hypothetical protein